MDYVKNTVMNITRQSDYGIVATVQADKLYLDYVLAGLSYHTLRITTKHISPDCSDIIITKDLDSEIDLEKVLNKIDRNIRLLIKSVEVKHRQTKFILDEIIRLR